MSSVTCCEYACFKTVRNIKYSLCLLPHLLFWMRRRHLCPPGCYRNELGTGTQQTVTAYLSFACMHTHAVSHLRLSRTSFVFWAFLWSQRKRRLFCSTIWLCIHIVVYTLTDAGDASRSMVDMAKHLFVSTNSFLVWGSVFCSHWVQTQKWWNLALLLFITN